MYIMDKMQSFYDELREMYGDPIDEETTQEEIDEWERRDAEEIAEIIRWNGTEGS